MEQLLKQRETWLAGRAKLEAWHAQTREEALEPDLEIVDPHHHMWDYRQLLGYNLLGIFKQQYYLADELVDDIVGAGHNDMVMMAFVLFALERAKCAIGG